MSDYRILSTRDSGGVNVTVGAPKESIERTLGKSLTDAEYKEMVMKTVLKQGTYNVREIASSDIPADREFRDAWVDVTPDSKIDICCTKAKAVKLAALRQWRNKQLEATDVKFLQAVESGKTEDMDKVKAERKKLRDMTEPLKAVDTEGKVNDEAVLDTLRSLAVTDDV